MAKGILVVDIPENCYECYMSELYGDGVVFCGGCERNMDYTESRRPDWCPIKSIPEKQINNNLYDEYYEGFDAGWNACIDEILKGD